MRLLKDPIVTTPDSRAATFPWLSITIVDGIALAGREPLKPIRSASSMRVG
jgi:hypothetical protein